MRLEDLDFSATDCCALHQTATVELPSGDDAGIIRGEDDTYSVTIYRDGGLWRRECCIPGARVQQILSGQTNDAGEA